jgi:hypothetical protein
MEKLPYPVKIGKIPFLLALPIVNNDMNRIDKFLAKQK